MRRWTWIAPAVAGLALALPGYSAPALATIYSGQTAQEAGLTLGGWGSGLARESKDEVLSGTRSIQVFAEGYYSGARLDFVKPVDMSRYAAMNGVSLRFELKFSSATKTSDAGGGLVPGGGFQVMPGGPPMAGGPPMVGPRITPGIPITDEDAAPTIATKALRVVLFSGKTRVAAVDQAVDPDANTNGWIHVYVPLAAFKGTGGVAPDWTTFKANRMLLFGDATDSFYIGDISILQTDLAITQVSVGEDQDIYSGETAEFKASASGGAGLKYSWDFDATDGIQTDAIGRNVTFRYRKAGDYTVTLTVSDPTGVMKSVTKTTGVKVNE